MDTGGALIPEINETFATGFAAAERSMLNASLFNPILYCCFKHVDFDIY
jgi:hypothetical protein